MTILTNISKQKGLFSYLKYMRQIIYTHAHLDIHIALYTIQESATFTLLFYYYVCVSVR